MILTLALDVLVELLHSTSQASPSPNTRIFAGQLVLARRLGGFMLRFFAQPHRDRVASLAAASRTKPGDLPVRVGRLDHANRPGQKPLSKYKTYRPRKLGRRRR
jgi:hypothetical protein